MKTIITIIIMLLFIHTMNIVADNWPNPIVTVVGIMTMVFWLSILTIHLIKHK